MTYADRVRSRQDHLNRRSEDLQFSTGRKAYPGGTANYFSDSYGTVLDELLSSGAGRHGGAGGVYTSILENYQGKTKHLDSFLENSAPFIGASLQGTEAFRRIQNTGTDDPMKAYGQVSTQIDRGAEHGITRGRQNLRTSGLGSSSMRSSLARSAYAGAAEQKSGAYNQLYARRNQISRGAATSAFDAHRLVGALSLNLNPNPSLPGGGGGPSTTSKVVSGAAAGAATGTTISPGIGTVVGAVVGGVAGGFS